MMKQKRKVPIIGKRESKKLDKLRRIKEAARELFKELGYEATTTQAIAKKAQIGFGTLFLYAPVKEDLLFIVFLDDLIEVVTKARKAVSSETTLIDKAYRHFNSLLSYHAKDLELSRLFSREMFGPRTAQRRADAARLMSSILDPLAEWIREEQAQKHVGADIAPEEAAAGFMAFYFAIVSRFIGGAASLRSSRQSLRRSFEFYFRGLRP